MSTVIIVPPAIASQSVGFDRSDFVSRSSARTRSEVIAANSLLVQSFLDEVQGDNIAMNEAIPVPRILNALGLLLVDDQPELVARMMAAGATALPNDVFSLVHPDVHTEGVGEAWHLEMLKAKKARENGLTGAGIRIGILDTGIDAGHSEFSGKSVSFQEFDASGSAVTGSARDTGNHGTHVSAIAAGRTTGVAPDSALAVAAVLTSSGSGTRAQILAGLNWLISHRHGANDADVGVDVLNASLGSSAYNNFLHGTLTAAMAVGIHMVAAIGNSGSLGINRHGSPGNYDIVTGVGAVDSAGNIAAFSDWGTVPQHGGIRKPDLAAPGVNIRSAVPGGGMAFMSGTSMAAPMVAGACALVLQKNPALKTNPAQLATTIAGCVKPSSGPNAARFGSGVLDLSLL